MNELPDDCLLEIFKHLYREYDFILHTICKSFDFLLKKTSLFNLNILPFKPNLVYLMNSIKPLPLYSDDFYKREISTNAVISTCDIDWIKKINLTFSENSFFFAIHNNSSINYLNQLYKYFKIGYETSIRYNWEDILNSDLYNEACLIKRTDIIIWLKEKGVEIKRSAFNSSVQSDSMFILKFMHETFPLFDFKFIPNIYFYAIINENLDIIEWLYNNKNVKLTKNEMMNALKYNSNKVIQWLCDHNCPKDSSIFAQATEFCSLDVMKLLYQYDYPLDELSLNRACLIGDIDKFNWIINKNIYPELSCWLCALDSKNINLYERLSTFITPSSYPYIINNACFKGDIDNVKWLFLHNCELTEQTITTAILKNDIELVNWLIENKCPLTEMVFRQAGINGTKVIFECLYNNKCPYDNRVFSQLAKRGDFDLIKWVYERQFPWNEKTFANAIKNNSLEIVEWFYNKGCPYNEKCIYYATVNNNFTMLEWLYMRGFPMSVDSYNIAIELEFYELAYWLQNKGCPTNNIDYHPEYND